MNKKLQRARSKARQQQKQHAQQLTKQKEELMSQIIGVKVEWDCFKDAVRDVFGRDTMLLPPRVVGTLGTISQYMTSLECPVKREWRTDPIAEQKNKITAAYDWLFEVRYWAKEHRQEIQHLFCFYATNPRDPMSHLRLVIPASYSARFMQTKTGRRALANLIADRLCGAYSLDHLADKHP